MSWIPPKWSAGFQRKKKFKCVHNIQFALEQDKLTLKQLESLIGLLNFACNIVLPGRAFLRRLIYLTIGIKKEYYRIRMTKQVKKDLEFWFSFLKNFNRSCMFLPDMWVSSSELRLYTDASGSVGYAAVFGSQWFKGEWNNKWQYQNITVLELYPIVLAVKLWSKYMANRCILFNTDNQALVHVINKQTF